ncbi:hypothetical protein RJ55_01471 [Drechmeria coniospora]|nr:hypothetical protein RJ55_01471 [Drechmeria coniospora]
MPPTKLRGGHPPWRPFCVTVLLLSLLTAYSFLKATYRRRLLDARTDTPTPPSSVSLFARTLVDRECSDVHLVDDQCAFVKRYCSEDDAGLLPYLEFYYCTLANAKAVAFVLLVAWLGLLFTTIGIAASDFFSVNLSTIAAILGLSESLAGVTFLAFGNGSPDVFSTFAAMSSNSASMAVGELIGAACFITGVVAGSMALVREFRVDRKTYARDICFFIVAVCFTMSFLADGQLRFWECWAMIGYYILYVVAVVGWHWYSTRRRRRIRREGEARSHFYAPAGQSGDELAGEPYRDEPDESGYDPSHRPSQPTSPGREASVFERGPRIEIQDDAGAVTEEEAENADEDHERMLAAEVTRSMRVLRTGAKRHNNMNPIRPSLVGALEFRSALAQLQRESNLQLSSIPGRSYSDHHIVSRRARRGTVATLPEPYHDIIGTPSTPAATARTRRDRALSSGDRPTSAVIPELLQDASGSDASPVPTEGIRSGQRTPVPSYALGGSLAPPPSGPTGISPALVDDASANGAPDQASPATLHRLQIPGSQSCHSAISSPNSSLYPYTDSPMVMTPHVHSEQAEFLLPPPALPRRDAHFPDVQSPVQTSRPIRWWPHSILPPPQVLLGTLFPTLQGWREKSYLDKFLSTISVPSIFLLVVTLPVVEPEASDDDSDASSTGRTIVDRIGNGQPAPTISFERGEEEPESEWERYRKHSVSHASRHSESNGLGGLLCEAREEPVAEPAATATAGQQQVLAKPSSDVPSVSNANDETASWNRWLVCLQLFTGPLFAVFILWANFVEDWDNPAKELLLMTLYTLLGSLVLLAILLLTTSESARPRFHYLLCFLGFIISIAWISTIAGEVVGVLKAFGVIIGISEALLGLTVFAAGNSIGDLVADITVARLGYPVMALSACFGGPMLNILLGIGIGGVMMMIQRANHKHKKHPDRPVRYGPYKVQVGGTLMISSITLLIMLVLLLIIVPMNKWILSRKIGWGLIALWTLSTIVNVIVEATGIWGEA